MGKTTFYELFNNKFPNRCPVSHDNRIWLERSFSFLLDIFHKEKIRQREILIPGYANFPIQYTGDDETALGILKIVAEKMEVEFNKIRLNLYDGGIHAMSSGGKRDKRIFLNSNDRYKTSAGLYRGRQADNKYHIGLERKKLAQPEIMVATLAHELAHIKLLGENKMKVNDEKLTDLTTVVFGLGIFNANAAFQTIRTSEASGWRKMGYLTQMEWGYALSLLAYIRNEKAPGWMEYLTGNVKEDFKQGERFIENNKDLVFSVVRNFN